MHTDMTVDDAINVARVVGDLRGDDADGEVRREVSPLRRARSTRLRRCKTGRIDARPRPPLTALGFGR